MVGDGNLKSSSIRLPDFLILGTQKGGTTSLYNYLIKHPDILPAAKKELHFFDKDKEYRMGLLYYKRQFPLSDKQLIGEATPNYLFHPLAPQRIAKDLPQTTKFIILLRNPIDRAFSRYKMKVRKGLEKRTFEQALIDDDRQLTEKFPYLKGDRIKGKSKNKKVPYVTAGIYVHQLKTWFNLFPPNQFLIIKSEDFFNKTKKVMSSVFRFLGLDKGKWNIKRIKKYNKGKYSKEMNPKTRSILIDYYRPYNQLLDDFLGRKFNWDQ